jgi:hypothetical protein
MMYIDQRDEGGRQYSAPADFISNHVDDASGTIELRATFQILRRLARAGQLVNVSVELGGIAGATVIPREGVNSGPEGQYAYVVTADNKADQRLIKVLYDDGTFGLDRRQRAARRPRDRRRPASRRARRRRLRRRAQARAGVRRRHAMNVSRRFIDYPVMTTLVMAAIVIFGLVGYFTLPVNELPNVDFPTISVSANLPGADPETMASAVAAPLENVFTTVPGIDSMTSTSSQGNTQIIIQFKLDRNIDAAAQDVQAAMSSALRQLPKTMIDPPTFKKENPAEQPILFLSLSSKTLPMTMVDRYAETLLARQLSTLNGVRSGPSVRCREIRRADPGRPVPR